MSLVRQRRRVFGKIYFWDPASQHPRGLLFNANIPSQQKFFQEEALYHAGDLALHWPLPDKDSDIMRKFANELLGVNGCTRWSEPLTELPDVYQPSGTGASSLVSPMAVLQLVYRSDVQQAALLQIETPESVWVLRWLLAHASSKRIDVLCSTMCRSLPDSVNILPHDMMTQIPAQRYGFIFFGWDMSRLDNSHEREQANADLQVTFTFLEAGGLAATPLFGCNGSASIRFGLEDPWRQTRTVWSPTSEDGCGWAYMVRPFGNEDVASSSSLRHALQQYHI